MIKAPIKLTQHINYEHYERVKKCPMDTTHFSISRQVEKSIKRNLLAFLFLGEWKKRPLDATRFPISRQVKKASNGQLPECRQNLLFNKVSYKELLSLFNLRIICEQSEQQNDTYRRGESGCNINKTSHLEVLREWYRIPIFIVRCTTPAQLTR